MTKAPKTHFLIFTLMISLISFAPNAEARKKKNNIFNKIGNAVTSTVKSVGNGVKQGANFVGGGVKQGANFVGGGIRNGIGGIKNKFVGGGAQPAFEEEPMMEEEVAYEEEPMMEEEMGMDEEVAMEEAYEPEMEQSYSAPPRKKFGGFFGKAKAAMERARAQAAAQAAAKAAAQAAAAKRAADRQMVQNSAARNVNGINSIQGAMAKAQQSRAFNSAMQVPLQNMRAENRVVSRGGVFGRNVRNVSHYQAPEASQVRTGRVSISGASFMQRGSRSVQRAVSAAQAPGRVANNSLISGMSSRAALSNGNYQQKPMLKPMPIQHGRPMLKPGLRIPGMLASKNKLSDIRIDNAVALNDNFSHISTKLNAIKAATVIREPASATLIDNAQVKYAQPQQAIRYANPVQEFAPVKPIKSFARPSGMMMQNAVNNYSN